MPLRKPSWLLSIGNLLRKRSLQSAKARAEMADARAKAAADAIKKAQAQLADLQGRGSPTLSETPRAPKKLVSTPLKSLDRHIVLDALEEHNRRMQEVDDAAGRKLSAIPKKPSPKK